MQSMKGATTLLGSMNRQMNLPALQRIAMEFEKENDIMDQRQEMMDDAIDDVTGLEDEEEGEEQKGDPDAHPGQAEPGQKKDRPEGRAPKGRAVGKELAGIVHAPVAAEHLAADGHHASAPRASTAGTPDGRLIRSFTKVRRERPRQR